MSTANDSLEKQFHMTEINKKYTHNIISHKTATNALLHMVRFMQSILFLTSFKFHAMKRI